MSSTYLGLGSNKGDRLEHLHRAVERLQQRDAIDVVSVSPVYETEAHTTSPDETQPSFLNAVTRLAVEVDPDALLRVAHEVERAEGRIRAAEQRWGPRPLDVDLLAVGSLTRNTEALTLPHPRLAERRFVLRPWADLAPNFVVPPPFDQSIRSLFDECGDPASIQQTDYTIGDETASPEAPGTQVSKQSGGG
ncbi:2-amino-4-hydroxy-6-hydroxymethyldihydropteridine diphosphokinase [Salinibacter grassmerensis]|uniref:2-amino-4-hydroxy-6- hydroxymethyldihydropteridine diphosphokinase n=1 Tax=Salinibacter grassmerensis TaxID=3040353 RepID=UPI0021E6F707|nr:2-amino-4-hydroxy-6-hydroxymethyldihydropteridine diphosphokinase [Salinibacter grassmerensis]